MLSIRHIKEVKYLLKTGSSPLLTKFAIAKADGKTDKSKVNGILQPVEVQSKRRW